MPPQEDRSIDIHGRIERVLIPAEAIAARIDALAEEIAGAVGDEPLTIAAVMTGSLIFVADLIRRLPLMMKIHMVSLSSYPGTSTTSQGVRVRLPLPEDLSGQTVLIVDDIYDSGRTLTAAVAQARAAGARRVLSCVLLRKPDAVRAESVARPEFVGFDIENTFVVGYGLDYNDYYRNLPYIAAVRELSDTR